MLRRVYFSGVLAIGIPLLVGNIYYGYKLNKYLSDRTFILEGLCFGLKRAFIFSPFSWMFLVSILYKHTLRKKDKSHYMMYYIPDSNRLIKFSLYKDFFLGLGISSKRSKK